MDIPRKDLKLHLECINGRWVTSSRNQEDAVDVQNRVGVHSPNPKGKPAQATDTAAQLTSTVPVDNFWENILSSSLDKSEDMDINKTSNETDDIIFSDQEKIEQSISAKEIEVLQPFDEGREGQETEAPMTLGVCHARTPIRSPIDVESQCVLSFRTSKGKRSNFPNRKARNPIVSEHISFPKTHVQCQKKQHVVLPTQQMKEPSGVELDGIGGVSNQKQHVMKRKRGRPKGSGKKCNRQYPDSGAVGMPFQPKGHENDLTSTEMTSFQTEDTQLPSYDVEEHQVLSKWLEKSDSSRVNNNGGTEDEAAINDLTVVQTCTQLLSPTVEKSNPATNGGTDVEAADNELTIVQTDCTQLLNPAMVKHQISLCLKKCNPPTVEDTRDNQLMLNEATTLTGTVDEASSIDLAVVETYSTQLLSPIVVEHQTVSLCIEKSNPAINGGAEIEAANDDLTTVQTDHTQLLSPAMDDHQTLYFGTGRFNPSTMEDTGDNQLMLNEATTLTVTSTKSLMYSQSSTEVESACNLKGGGDKRYQASVEVTVNTFSSSMQEDEEQLPQENGSLPFIKSFSLWESVESMDVFKLFPQHPHFRPLEKLNEEFREGIAFGKMWSLVSLMERTCQAQIDDPKSTFENKLDALNDLERHGFTVQPLRSRLETLLEIKDRYSSLDYSSKTIETEFIDDKRQFDEIIESITRLNTQLKALLMEKERKSLEVVELQKIEDENAEKFQAARLDFYSVLASPWN